MEFDQLSFNLDCTQRSAKLWQQQAVAAIFESCPSCFDFHVELCVRQKYKWIIRQENGVTTTVKEEEAPTTREHFLVDHRIFLQHSSTLIRFLSQILECMNIQGDYDMQSPLFQQIYLYSHEMMDSVMDAEEGQRKLSMCIEISLVDLFFYDEQAVMARALSESTDGVNGVISASKSSIDALQRVRFKDQDSSTINDCTICLEELTVGSLVTRMPCSHFFHGKCITQWLETSHLCPLCRFEMPP